MATKEEKMMAHIYLELDKAHGSFLRSMHYITGDGPFYKNDYPKIHRKLKGLAKKTHKITKKIDKYLP